MSPPHRHVHQQRTSESPQQVSWHRASCRNDENAMPVGVVSGQELERQRHDQRPMNPLPSQPHTNNVHSLPWASNRQFDHQTERWYTSPAQSHIRERSRSPPLHHTKLAVDRRRDYYEERTPLSPLRQASGRRDYHDERTPLSPLPHDPGRQGY